jgi:fructose-specific phosphotransferase system IIC component
MKLSEAQLLKILLLTLGLIVLSTTVWASLQAEYFQDKALQNMGGIVFGVMTVTLGLNLDNSYNTKASLLTGFVLVIGTAYVTREFCYLAAGLAETGGSVVTTVAIPFIGVIMGFVLSWSSGYVSGRKRSRSIRTIWLLVVASFVGISAMMMYHIIELIPLYGTTPAFFAVLIGYLCYLALFIYGLNSVFSYEIRYNMNIGVKPAPEEES